MRPESRVLLWDAIRSAEAIQTFIRDRSFSDYTADEMLRAAVERKFAIIGEALNQLSQLDPELAARIPERRQIIAFRNLLIHGYAAVRDSRVWQIAHEELPRLESKLMEISGTVDESG